MPRHRSDGSYGSVQCHAVSRRWPSASSVACRPNTLAFIRAAQESDGGWNFAGDPTGVAAPADTDTTALAIQALVAGRGAKRTDPDLRQGLTFLAHNHQADGSWQSFGSARPELDRRSPSSRSPLRATTRVTSCWRDSTVPASKIPPYTSPVKWLKADAGERTVGSRARTTRSASTPSRPRRSIQALRRSGSPSTGSPRRRAASAERPPSGLDVHDGGGSSTLPRRGVAQDCERGDPGDEHDEAEDREGDDRPTGACTSSPSRVRPVDATRELPFTLTLRAPNGRHERRRPSAAGRARSRSRSAARRRSRRPAPASPRRRSSRPRAYRPRPLNSQRVPCAVRHGRARAIPTRATTRRCA